MADVAYPLTSTTFYAARRVPVLPGCNASRGQNGQNWTVLGFVIVGFTRGIWGYRSPMRPRIYIERQRNAWAVQALDAPPTTVRFQTKARAVAEGTREASRVHGEMVVLTGTGRIDRWESFSEPTSRHHDWIGEPDTLTG